MSIEIYRGRKTTTQQQQQQQQHAKLVRMNLDIVWELWCKLSLGIVVDT